MLNEKLTKEQKIKDYGSDPLGNGKFRMIPSGDIVDSDERNRRLSEEKSAAANDCFGLSWERIAIMQGGLSTLDVIRKRQGMTKRRKL